MPDIFIAEPTTETAAPIEPTPLINDAEVEPLQNPVHLFSAFKKDPDGVDFKDKEGEEKIILFIRRSFITNIHWIFFGSLFLILPVFLSLVVHFLPNPLPHLPAIFYVFFTAFYYLVVATYWFITFGIPVIIFFFLLAFFCEYFGSTLAIILYIIFAMIIMLVNFCVVSDMFLRSRVLHYMQE